MRVTHIVSLFALIALTDCSGLRVREARLSYHPAASVPRPVQAEQKSEGEEDGPRADSPEEAARFLRKQRWHGPGEFPTERYVIARENVRRAGQVSLETRRMVAKSLTPRAGFGTAWQALGPGNVGGRVRALAIDPNNANNIYAASATGGVWNTTDGGQTWAPLTDFLPVLSAYSLVMDPTHSKTLYLGTGEWQLWGNGIYKTTNGGATWSELAATDNLVASSHFSYVHQIAISPTRPTNLYAATDSGLFVSLDAGNTWNQALPQTTGTYLSCNSVVARGDQPTDIVYAACGSYETTAGNFVFSIYANTDAAGTGTWNVVQADPMMGTTVLAIAPSAPTTVYALSVTSATTGPFYNALYAVFQSTSGGTAGTWVKKADTSDPTSLTANILSYPSCGYSTGNGSHSGQGAYNLVMAVDPTKPNTVFVGGIDLFRSDDGGATFGYADFGPGNATAHPDQHAFAFPPGYNGTTNQTLFVGNDGGVFQTNAALGAVATTQFPQCFANTTSGIGWSNLNYNFETTQFYFGTILPGGASYFGGSQDNGTSIGNNSTGVNGWTYLYGGDGGQVMADPVDTSHLFYEYIYLSLQKSTDGGLSSAPAINGISEPSDDFNFINYYTYDPSDPLKMYTGGTQLWRTVDGAENWTAASAPIPTDQDIISVEAVDPSDRDDVYFGTDEGAFVYRTSSALTTDGTTTWASTQLQSSGGYISGFAFDPNLPLRVYATLSTFRVASTDAQVYKSDDQGATWTAVGNGPAGLQDVPVTAMVVDPDDSSTLYVGTDIGLFASYDGGNTWTQAAAPFADAETTTLRIEYEGTAKVLYAFTFGRGVWKLNVNGNPLCTYALSTNSITVAGDAAVGSIGVTAPTGCPWSAQSGGDFASVQSPATGNGSGTFFYNIPYNDDGQIRTDTLFVQGMPVTVTQSATTAVSHNGVNDDISSANVVSPLPYGDVLYDDLTSSPTDPMHSCTGSADTETAWYKLTAPQSGTIEIDATGESYTYYGDTGLVITAYPLTGVVIGPEIVCAQIPQNPGTVTTLSAQFAVQAGQSYAIEFSVPNSQVSFIQLSILMEAGLSVTPAVTQLTAGQTVQLSASVSGNANTGVRWSNAPAQMGSVNLTGLYTAPSAVDGPTQVTVTAQSFATPDAAGSATITVTPLGISFPANGVANAASFQNGPLAPGEIITIFGTSLGPVTLAPLQLDANGNVSTTAGGTQVTFDGLPAPMVYALSGQVAAIVPYEVAGKTSTQVVVSYNGAQSAPVALPITNASPALFTSNSSGSGQAAIVDQDGLINGPTIGAPRGSIVSMYGTGQGQTNPAGVDGTLATGSVLPQPVLPVTVQIGGQNATVYYAGAAPDLVAGVFQINVEVPTGLQPGNQPVVVNVGTQTSAANVTLNVLGPDGREGELAYNNTGTTDVTLTAYNPADPTVPIVVGMVPAGKYYLLGNLMLGSDWGVQVNSTTEHVVSQVCGFASNANPMYWTCSGSATQPFVQ
jgi:uncharacterized protein (TIGR03437 family)